MDIANWLYIRTMNMKQTISCILNVACRNMAEKSEIQWSKIRASAISGKWFNDINLEMTSTAGSGVTLMWAISLLVQKLIRHCKFSEVNAHCSTIWTFLKPSNNAAHFRMTFGFQQPPHLKQWKADLWIPSIIQCPLCLFLLEHCRVHWYSGIKIRRVKPGDCDSDVTMISQAQWFQLLLQTPDGNLLDLHWPGHLQTILAYIYYVHKACVSINQSRCICIAKQICHNTLYTRAFWAF